MRKDSRSRFPFSILVVGMAFGGGARAGHQSQPDVQGLSLALTCDATEAAGPTLRATLRNSGGEDTALVAGITLANGKVYLPTNFKVHARTLPGHEDEEFSYADPEHARIGGRLDPWVVPLPQGSSYTLSMPARHFMSTTSFKPLELTRKGLEIRLALDAKPIARTIDDMAGLRLLRIWVGRLASSALGGATCQGPR